VQAQKKNKEKTHSLIVDLKRIALELGKTPTRDEFVKHSKYTKHDVNNIFKSFTIFVQSSGLEVSKRNNKIFDKDIETEIENYKLSKKDSFDYEIENSIIFCVGDTHFPFVDEDALSMAYVILGDLVQKNPDKTIVIIQMGDLYDMMAQASFPKSLNNYNPFEEIQKGHKMAQDMWTTLKSIAPKNVCFQLMGNHTIRPLKRIIESAPECEPFFSIDKFVTFDGVETIKDNRQELIINDIIFIHGHKSRLGDHRDYNMANTVCGHSHTGGVSFKRFFNKVFWELNAGYLADPKSKALGYIPQKITRWTQGVGVVDHLGPRFIPFD
jgi:hypothetical protein